MYVNNRSTINKYPKSQVYNAIAGTCANKGIRVTKLEKISTTPPSLRHICNSGGIQFLGQESFSVPYYGNVINVPFYICPSCGKLFVFKDFYD